MTMTRASAGTRVDENGLVNYAEIIGSELVTNGDFATSDLSSFTTIYATQAIVSEELKVTLNTANGYGISNVYFSAVIGKSYRIQADVQQGTANNTIIKHQSGITLTSSGNQTGSWSFDGVGVATATSCAVRLQAYGDNGDYAIFDNVSVKEVTRDNLARVDYTDGTGSLLVEPQRTNLIHYSEDFTDTYWTSNTDVETPVKSTTIKSPDGNYNAWHIVKDGSNSKIARVIGSSSVEYSKSIWARTISGSGTAYFGNGSLASGVLTTVTTEWQRIEITSSVDNFYAVDFRGSSTLTEVLIWGAQMEEGSYPTSYIPTDGGTVTRVKDQYEKTGISNLINSDEGVLFAEIAALDNDGTFRMIAISDGTIDNVVNFYYRTDINKITIRLKSGSTQEIFENFDITATNFNKVAFRYKSGESNLFINGVKQKVSDYTSTNMPIGLSQLSLDSGGNTNFFYGKVKQLQVFKTALTDEQLKTLTT